MNTGIHSGLVAGFLAAVCWIAAESLSARQPTGEPGAQTDLPGTSASPEGSPSSPTQSRELSSEEMADVFMARKSYADALEYYQRALRENRYKEASLWNKIGIANQNLHSFSAARKAYKKAIHLKKEFPEPYNNMGTTYYLSKKAKKSLKWYRQAIQHNPGNPTFHYNLGTALYATKKIKEAVEAYRHALELDPDFFAKRSSVGTTLEARPEDAKYFFYMAKVFASLHRPAEAVRYLRRALEDGFNDFDLIDRDPDIQTIAEYPPYVELRANPPRPL